MGERRFVRVSFSAILRINFTAFITQLLGKLRGKSTKEDFIKSRSGEITAFHFYRNIFVCTVARQMTRMAFHPRCHVH